jgi:hypothetical protein
MTYYLFNSIQSIYFVTHKTQERNKQAGAENRSYTGDPEGAKGPAKQGHLRRWELHKSLHQPTDNRLKVDTKLN